jgi:hypothetical protein
MKLHLLDLQPTPAIAPAEVRDIAFGFEGGTAHKVDDRYFVFTTECFAEPKTAASRLALYISDDGRTFSRHSTVLDLHGDWREPDSFWNPWSPMVVFDEAANRWSLFYVHYVRKPGSDQPYNMTGRMARLDSSTPGRAGITGPWTPGGLIDLADDRPDPWEGSCKVVSFFPYKAADGAWWAFYGSNNAPEFIPPDSLPQQGSAMKFWVGLAKSADNTLTGRWDRQTALNPVMMDPDFIENPVVTRLRDDLFICVYDGGNTHAMSYAFSRDGIHWDKEQLLSLPAAPAWLKAVRTPLGLIPEPDGTCTIFFTAFDGVNPAAIPPLWHDGFGQLGRLVVRLSQN